MISGTCRTGRTSEESYLQKERSERIRRAIQELPEKYRTPIIIVPPERTDVREMTNGPGSRLMTIVKNRLYRARIMLREALMKERKGGGFMNCDTSRN